MCGICGFSGPRNDRLLRKMNSLLTHRGPDEEGYYCSSLVEMSFGMRRLSIIDAESGQQPMAGPSMKTHVVFNGEIYNAPALRTNLERAGTSFRTHHSDTEVLVQLYEREGPNMPSMLSGMFAFVIMDEQKGVLFGANDRFGIKPFYYSTAAGRLSFASEAKSLLTLPWISRDLDLQSLFHFLSLQSVPAPCSIFQNVQKLPPATAFIYDLEERAIKTWSYWSPSFEESSLEGDAAAENVRAALRKAIQRWSLSDVPLASSLSGGIDSSIVTGLLSSQLPSGELSTFTLGFADAPELDEREAARQVAKRCGTQHHELLLTNDELLEELPRMVWHLDEPYGGGLPSWFVFREIGKHAKVAMTGVGGDELFGSYGKWFPFVGRRARLRSLARVLRGSERWPVGSRYHPLYMGDGQKRLLLQGNAEGLAATEDFIEDLWAVVPTSDPANKIVGVDLKQQLPNEFLHMVDRFSMAHSVEARTPFLDDHFVQLVLSIRATERTAPGALKKLLVDATSDLLPLEVVSAPKKGFVLPQGRWLRAGLHKEVQQVTAPTHLKQQGLFEASEVQSLVGRVNAKDTSATQPLWTLFMFQQWDQIYRGSS